MAFGIHNSSVAAGNCFLCVSVIRASSCAEFEEKRACGSLLQAQLCVGDSQILSL